MVVHVGPGEYVPDATEGITRVEDLPAPEIIRRSRNQRRCACPQCGHSARRRKTVCRILHDLGNPSSGRPREMHLKYSQHKCSHCQFYFNAPMDDLAAPKSHYTHRVVRTLVRLVVEDNLPYRATSWHAWRDHRVFVPFATVQNWVEAAGKKRRGSGHPRIPRPGLVELFRLHRGRRVV